MKVYNTSSQNNTQTYKIGYRSSILAFTFTIAYAVVQILQLRRLVHFPYDELLIYGTSLGIVIPFLLAMLALHYTTAPEKKFWSHAAMLLSVMYAVFVTANYVVQLATVVPAKMNGTISEIKLLEQTPHSLFWDFDALGYILMGIAMLFALPVFEKTGFQKWVRLSFLANGLMTPLISIVYFYPVYSERLLMLGMPWGITAPLAMLMLALYFKKQILMSR
jgi:hypothetical protein